MSKEGNMSEIKHPDSLDKSDAYFLFGWLQGIASRLRVISKSVEGKSVCAELNKATEDIENMLNSYQALEGKNGKKSKA